MDEPLAYLTVEREQGALDKFMCLPNDADKSGEKLATLGCPLLVILWTLVVVNYLKYM